MDSFATLDDLTGGITPWVTNPPDSAAALLRSATIVVSRACNLDPYTYVPDASTAQPLADATCAQATAWITLGITPEGLGLDTAAPVKKSTILGADVERDTTGRLAALQTAASGLAPEAAAILLTAGLLWQAVPVGPTDDHLRHYGLGDERPFSWDFANRTDAFEWPFW